MRKYGLKSVIAFRQAKWRAVGKEPLFTFMLKMSWRPKVQGSCHRYGKIARDRPAFFSVSSRLGHGPLQILEFLVVATTVRYGKCLEGRMEGWPWR